MADMRQWAPVKLKDVCTQITVGFVGSMADEYCDEGVPFLRSLNIQPFRINTNDLKYIPQAFHDRIKKSTLRPGDVGIVRTGYPGTACVIPPWLKEANCSDLVIVRPGPALNPHFLAAVFNSSFGRDLVGGNLVGAAQQHFNVTVAKELKLLLPPRCEQDKIAAMLSAYDELIANNQRRIALLEGMAEQIYREWFVRMRFPGAAHAKAGVPAGWTVVEIGKRFRTYLGGTPSRAEAAYWGGCVPWINSGEVNKIRISAPSELITERGLHESAAKLMPIGTTVLAITGATLGQVSFLTIEAAANQSVVGVHDPSQLANIYAHRYLKANIQTLIAKQSGGGQQHVNKDIVEKELMLVPTDQLLGKFNEVVVPIYQQIEELLKGNVKLTAIRDVLLPRLISGKLKVDNLDIRLPPSMRAEVESAEATA